MLIDENTSLELLLTRVKESIHDAVKVRNHPFRFCVLATTGSGQPDLRYTVLRRVDDQFRLFIYTDSRTLKVRDIHINKGVSILFYDPNEKFQLRVQGTAKLHLENEVSQSHWSEVPIEGKKAYTSVKPPGEPVNNPQEAYNWYEKPTSEHFAVIEIKPHQMDALQLDDHRHMRAQFNWSVDRWLSEWVAP